MADDDLVGHLGLGSNNQPNLKWPMVILKFVFKPEFIVIHNGMRHLHLIHMHSSQFSSQEYHIHTELRTCAFKDQTKRCKLQDCCWPVEKGSDI